MGAGKAFLEKPGLRVDALALGRGGRVLFEGLSFAAGAGDYVEVAGANGSGKTSLLRALAGFLKPRAGKVSFANVEDPAMALHYVGHLNALKPTLSVSAHVRYWARLLGAGEDAGAAVARVGLSHMRDAPARALSQGQARRLALARLVAVRRPIWLLDEPAAALDSEGRAMLAELIAVHRGDGGVVIATVHEALGPTPSSTLVLH